jgi:hypothetical protein
MPDYKLDGLDERLAALADHAQRSARLDGAQAVRARADRRRHRRHVVAASLGALLVVTLGTAVLAHGRAPGTSPTLAVPSSAVPSPDGGSSAAPSPGGQSAPPGAVTSPPTPPPKASQGAGTADRGPKPGTTATAGMFSGTRQVALIPTALQGGMVAVDPNLRVGISATDDARALFMIQPWEGDKYLIKMATTLEQQHYCLEASQSASPSMFIFATICDAQVPTQLFTFEPASTQDGVMAWTIRTFDTATNENAYLQLDPPYPPAPTDVELFAAIMSVTDVPSTFTLADRGPAVP